MSTGQTVATVLLLIHLLSLMIGVVSNAGPLSPFRMALRKVPLVPQYLQLLDMDRGYDFPLTLGPPEEGAYQLQLTTQSAQPGSIAIRLPDISLVPRIRRGRYEKLALGMADLAAIYEGDPHHQTLLAVGVGKCLLDKFDLPAGNYDLQVQRQTPQRLEDILLGLTRETPATVVGMSLLGSQTGELQVALHEQENLTATVRLKNQQGGNRQAGSHSRKTTEQNTTSPTTKPPITKP